MNRTPDYHAAMKGFMPGGLIVLAVALLQPSAFAQHPSHGSVPRTPPPMHFRTAIGPTFVPRLGIVPTFHSPTPCCGTFSGGFTFGVGNPSNPFYPPNLGPHHHGVGFNNFGGVVIYPVPYAVPVYPYPYYGYDTGVQDSQGMQTAEEQQQEAPAPTIFENRPQRAVPPAQPAPEEPYADNDNQDAAAAVTNGSRAEASAPEPSSVLIFRDGHQLEVTNYAIVGDTLYDLTPGHTRKIALANIDIPATVEANDDRGLTFRVPVQN